MGVKVREEKGDKGVGIMDVRFYQACVLVEKIGVCEGFFCDAEEIIFGYLVFAVSSSFLKVFYETSGNGTNIVKLISIQVSLLIYYGRSKTLVSHITAHALIIILT